MKFATIISVIFYICSSFYILTGIYVHVVNAKSRINRLFMLLMTSMATWSFAFSISTSAPTAEASAFWKSVSVFGWGVFYSLLLHFLLALSKNKSLLNKRSTYIVLYLPAVINIILFAPFGYLGVKQYEMIPSDFGWLNVHPINIWGIWLILYYIIFSIAGIMLLVLWWRKTQSQTFMHRQATYFLITALFPVLAAMTTDFLPGVLDKNLFLKLAIVLNIIPTIMLFLTLKRSGVILEKNKITSVSPKSDDDLNRDRLRLFDTTAATFSIGAALSFLIGYFGQKGLLERELSLTIIFFSIGIITKLIPRITRKHKIQNFIFLVVCASGILYFMITNVATGALTAWSVYILFLLFTVILDSRIHAAIFTALCIALQVIFWIFLPEVAVTLDGSEYLTRIIIIVLSYLVVRYLTNEYASKLQGYQKFSKEQEALERISTSFISVDNENAKEKIRDMLEMSVETLEFDHAYLIDFGADYEDATVINTYVKDVAIESFPYQPGVIVKTAALPMVETLIAQKQPIVCEDITSVPIDEGGEVRNFFASRGINSYFVMPIILENKLIGMLVIEYYNRSDLSTRENRLYFLKIIANILGDTRKKILYEESLYNYAYYDETTKLANRNKLRKNIEQILQDRIESEKVVIFDIELDNLRMINDTFGHSIGQQVEIKSATILENIMKEGCILSRIAEGKFIIVMPIAETAEQIEECANKIVDAFSNPILPKEGIESLFVTVNIGISVYPEDGRDADTLLKNADLAGFEAKSSDNKIVFCSDQLKNRIEENTLLTNRLFKAMQNKEFSLEFQPQVSCSTEKTVGVEALLRWNYDDKKRIPPDIFIPILEQTGLIHDVGLWVLEQALQEHKRLIAKGLPPLRFSINLSVVQFQKATFVLDVLKIIEENQVDPKYIELEITESLLSKNFSDSIEKLNKLKELGINIAIDDFGKGYSSLHRLELVPFDRIKIDKSIVDDITLENKKIVIVQTIVSLAKALMADITAEGVETKEQLDFMRDIDCDEIQGYYFSRPLPAETLEEFLKKE